MRCCFSRSLFLVLNIIAITPFCLSQTTVPESQGAGEASLPGAPRPSQKEILFRMPKDILKDQAGLWTSPTRLRSKDIVWLAPLAVATGVSFAMDHHTMSSIVSHDPSFNQANVNAANGLTGGLIAIPAALCGVGLLHNDSHQRETGMLSGEAVIDAYIVQEGRKLMTWRQRPALDNSGGRFLQGSAGADSLFPSNHSIIAWSSAAVIASGYHRR